MAAPTITSIGTYTTQITLNQSTFVQLKDAVKNAMTGLSIASGTTFSNGGTTGWDLVWEGKYDALSPHWTQVFRSLNVDGVTYKCSIFNWNIPNNELDICTCERFGTLAQFTAGTLSAMATTGGAITNPAWTFYNCATIGWKLDACDVIINAHPRWMLAHAYINSEPCLWAGVFELQRNDPMDTATQSNPCWGWIGSTLWHHGIPSETLTTLDGASTCLNNSSPFEHLLISMPSVMKYTGRVTGINAAIGFTADYGITQHPSWVHTQYAKQMCTFSGLLSNTNAKFQFNGWNPTKRLVMPITPIADFRSAGPVVLGQIYGIKVLGPVAENMNRVKLTVGSDGNFSSSGTSRDHFILNLHSKLNSPSYRGANVTITDIGTFPRNIPPSGDIITIGSAYFVLTRGQRYQLYRVDAFSGATTLVWDLTGNSATPYSMRFDGERYLYVCHSIGIAKIDVYSLTVVPQLTSTPTRGITFLNDYIVFAGSGVISSIPTLTKIQISTAAQTSFATPTVAPTYGSTFASCETDFYGNVLFVGSSAAASTGAAGSPTIPVYVVGSTGTVRAQMNSAAGQAYASQFACRMITETQAYLCGMYGSSPGSSQSFYGFTYDTANITPSNQHGGSTAYSVQRDEAGFVPIILKHSGNIYAFNRWYNGAASVMQCNAITSTNATGNLGYFTAFQPSFGISEAAGYSYSFYSCICTDGTRWIGPWGSSVALATGTTDDSLTKLRIVTGLTNSFQYPNVRLGQVAILA